MAAFSYRLSPHCVFVPGPEARSVTVIHSVYGSRFVLDAELLAALLGDPPSAAARASRKSTGAWTSAIRELVREKVLVDRPTYDRLTRTKSFTNRLGPLELAVLRGVNDGGAKAVPEGPPPPAVKSQSSRRTRSLTTHPLEGDVHTLAGFLAARQSVRTYATRRLSRGELEQFLQLTVRAYACIDLPGLGRSSLRNYPSGGARYALEIYPAVLNVQSLNRGFYYYHPFHHRLEFIGSRPRHLDALRQVVRTRMGRPDSDVSEPAVLFIVTAVFPRTCWKYTGIPFQLILQETGALYQTMYLAATMMRLAPCAVGAFPERAMGEILGLDPSDEAQVGLFALGVRADVPRSREAVPIVHFRVRRGSPFSPDRSAQSIELVFTGGETEIIDAENFKIDRSGDVLSCPVKRGRQQGIFTGQARTALLRWLRRSGRAAALPEWPRK